MRFYVLSQKEEVGCQVGMLSAALYDKYYPSADDVEYGLFPWYAEKGRVAIRTPFPDGMVLISKDKNYEFDIRSISRFFYIASDEFLAVCRGLNVLIVDSARIEVFSTKGENIFSKKYNAVLFEELDPRKDTDPLSSFVEDNGRPVRFKKLILPSEWDLDLFKYKRMLSGSDTLICSERFKELSGNLNGVAFTPLEDVVWSAVKRI